RSVYFGTELSIDSTTYISSVVQVFAGTIFILHTILAIIIYFVVIKNKEILYFSLGLFMFAILSLNSCYEKFIIQLIKMDFVYSSVSNHSWIKKKCPTNPSENSASLF